jgi:NAD(P) transhydrogenase subunit alpha
MIVGVLREARPGETRVAATPGNVAQLLDLGYGVVVEPGAGVASSFSDDAYAAAAASVGVGRGRCRVRRECAIRYTA